MYIPSREICSCTSELLWAMGSSSQVRAIRDSSSSTARSQNRSRCLSG